MQKKQESVHPKMEKKRQDKSRPKIELTRAKTMLLTPERFPDGVLSKIVCLLSLSAASRFVTTNKLIKAGTADAWKELVPRRRIKKFWRWCKNFGTTQALVRAYTRTRLADPSRRLILMMSG
jgi:hypothetical protein